MCIPKLIGIAGAMQSGKTSLANFLCDKIYHMKRHQVNAIAILPMASELKRITRLCFDATEKQVNGTGEEKETLLTCGKSCRKVMQTIATNFRDIDPDAWLNSWIEHATVSSSETSYRLIPDIRFENEVDYVHSNDGMMFWIIRVPQENQFLPETYKKRLEKMSPHVSEKHTELRESCFEKDRDIIIDNREMTERECHKYAWTKLMTKYINQTPTDLEALKILNCTPGIDRRGEKGLPLN